MILHRIYTRLYLHCWMQSFLAFLFSLGFGGRTWPEHGFAKGTNSRAFSPSHLIWTLRIRTPFHLKSLSFIYNLIDKTYFTNVTNKLLFHFNVEPEDFRIFSCYNYGTVGNANRFRSTRKIEVKPSQEFCSSREENDSIFVQHNNKNSEVSYIHRRLKIPRTKRGTVIGLHI